MPHKVLAESFGWGALVRQTAAHARTVPGGTVHALHPDGASTMCGQPAGDFVEFGLAFEDATFLRRCRPCRTALLKPTGS